MVVDFGWWWVLAGGELGLAVGSDWGVGSDWWWAPTGGGPPLVVNSGWWWAGSGWLWVWLVVGSG